MNEFTPPIIERVDDDEVQVANSHAKLSPPISFKNPTPSPFQQHHLTQRRKLIMESSSSEAESPIFLPKKIPTRKKKKQDQPWPKKKGSSGVTLEGYLEHTDGSSDKSGSDCGDLVGRTKSLTDEDLDELKGCLDLGFGFSYDEIPELCNTLPALELCYSMSQRFQDHHHKSPAEPPSAEIAPATATPLANWKFSSPGDDPEEVKARLKYWAQAVACTVRLCN